MTDNDHIFGGRYKIVGEVGRGGMGVIYRGMDSILDREVAIKVMSADFAETTDEARTRFFREAKAAARLQHRNIVTVFEFAEQDGIPYIVMEFLKGMSLSSRMRSNPPLTLDQKLDIMSELCNGLQFAHDNGVIHRDVKPANVWILEDGTVKLVDFGIAKVASSMTVRGEAMGSAAYMSPEQIEGQPVTGQSDVFSAAVVLYEIVARRRPFVGDSPTATMMQVVQGTPAPIESLVPDLPRDLIDAIAKGLEKDPERRFRTAGDFGAELQLIRMSLPREEETYLQPSRETVTSTLQFKAEPLPSQTATVPDRVGLSGKRGIWIGAAGVVLAAVVGLIVWLNRGPVTPTAAPAPVATGGPTTPVGPTNPAGPTGGPTTHAVRIETKPAGALIRVDGAQTGPSTPAVVHLAAGATIRLEKRGFETREVTPSEAELKRGALVFDLRETEAALVQLRIQGEYPFAVLEGTRQLSAPATEHNLSRREGTVLRLQSAEYFLTYDVRVEARNRAIAAPGLGRIYLTGPETCMVYLDGRRIDYLKRPMPAMAATNHTFTFECTDGTKLRPLYQRIKPGDNGEVFVGR